MGLAKGRPKFWNLNIFHKRDPFCFMQLFDPTHPEGQKSKLGYCFIEGTPLKLNPKKLVGFRVRKIKVGNLFLFLHETRLEGDRQTLTFGFTQLFVLTQPGGATGSCKSSERGAFPGLLNGSWEFGGSL